MMRHNRADLEWVLIAGACIQLYGLGGIMGLVLGHGSVLPTLVLAPLALLVGSALLVDACNRYLKRSGRGGSRWALLGLLNAPGALAVILMFNDKPPRPGHGFEVRPPR